MNVFCADCGEELIYILLLHELILIKPETATVYCKGGDLIKYMHCMFQSEAHTEAAHDLGFPASQSCSIHSSCSAPHLLLVWVSYNVHLQHAPTVFPSL